MNLSSFIARRYFWSKKKRNFINVISGISMFVVAIGTMALIIVLSALNGLEDLIKSLYNTFDPEIKIETTLGKSFEISPEFIQSIEDIEGVEVLTEIIEDNAYIRYNKNEMVAVLKGVGQNFTQHNRMESAIVQGEMKLHENERDFAVVGRGVQYTLNIAPNNDFFALQIFYPKNIGTANLNPDRMLNRKNIMVGGVFALEKQYDEKYIFVPLEFARDLLDYGNRRTSLEVAIQEGFSEEEVQLKLISLLGKDFKVLNSEEQHAEVLRIVKIEKLFVYLIFVFILSISSFNIFFALSMLAIDKKKDISVLYAMGAKDKLVRTIFLKEGAIISFGGAIVGLLLGFILVILQQEFGLISMGMQTSVINYYPMKMEYFDFIISGGCIVMITLAASLRPAHMATKYKSLQYI